MGVERIVYHSIKCDKCEKSLEDYKDNLSRLRPNRITAAKIAIEHGFVKTGSNWLCPKCVNEFCC